MIRKITDSLVRFLKEYLPSSYIIALFLTIVVFIAGVFFTSKGFMGMVDVLGKGMWGLLAFTLQITLYITILNLGVGIPTQVSNYINNDNVFIQAENGMLGVGAIATGDDIHPELINAGRQPVLQTPGCAFFDSSASFGMIRGGHIDATVLGAFEVDGKANVANWIIPGGKMLGVGGAMDLVAGANKVIIAMAHTSKGEPKLIKECTLPITGHGEVDVVVTELGMFFFEDGKIILKAIAPEIDVDYLRTVTGFEFEASENLKTMIP